MKLKKSYTFLYMPDGDGQSRAVTIRLGAILVLVFGLMALTALAGLYFVGVRAGSGWWPEFSSLKAENTWLKTHVDALEAQVGDLRAAMDEAFAYQQVVATAVNLKPLDDETFAAGVGGRQNLLTPSAEVPELATDGLRPLADLDQEIELLVRQARIQNQGYLAMMDTLAAREETRAHIPSIRPVDTGWLSSGFGKRSDPFTKCTRFHHGLDFAAPIGTKVRSTAAGKVIMVQQQRGLGKVVKIDHGDGLVTVYAHLSAFDVKKGQVVKRGDIIARSGDSGRSTAPHLHYEVRIDGRAVNPKPYILDTYAGQY